MIKILLEQMIEDTPPEVVRGEQERAAILRKFYNEDEAAPDGSTSNFTKVATQSKAFS